ncbi:MAG: TolC family protein [Rhodothermales bacterium]|nr:TolC family protein [Rhodothermales bacterium]
MPFVRLNRCLNGTLAVVLAGAATAQTPPASPLSPNRLPPLPDSLRLYGATVAVRTPLPDLVPADDAPLLTLDEAVRRALIANPQRQIAALDAALASGNATRAAAGYSFDLDATAGLAGSRSGGLGRNSAANPSGGRTSSSFSVGLGAGYTVYDGNRRGATLDRLRATARSAAFDADAVAEALVRDVVAAYLDVVREQLAVRAREEAVAVSEDRLRLDQARAEIGVAAPVDAALALADLNADRAALLAQRLTLQQARLALARLAALDTPDLRVATDADGMLPAGALSGNGNADPTKTALADTPTVRAFASDADAARAALREVAAEFLPTVRLTAGAGTGIVAADWIPVLDETRSFDVRYGVTASLPLFDGDDRARRLEAARIRVAQADLRTDDARREQRYAVARLAAARDGYRALLDLETQNRAVARQNVRVALAQQELGLLSSIDLRQIQLALVAAEQRRIAALYTLLETEAELRYRAGGFALDGTTLRDLAPADAPRPRGTPDPFDLRTYLGPRQDEP